MPAVALNQPKPSDIGSPELRNILAAPLPEPNEAALRSQPRKDWAKAVRYLLRSLGLSGISVTAPRYSMASSIDIRIPPAATHDLGRPHDFLACPLCAQHRDAQHKVEAIIRAAFPDMADRSDTQSDYFDNPLAIS